MTLKSFLKTHVLAPHDIYWLGAFCIIFGYMVIGGSLFGFPKYQMPAFPLLMLSIKPENGAKAPLKKTSLILIAFLFAVIPIAFPDPVYVVRVILKQAVLDYASPMKIMLPVALETVLLIFATLLFLKNGNARRVLLLSAFAFNFAFAVKQNIAPYSTGYIYGEAGECAEIAEYIRRLDKSAFVPAEIATLVNPNNYQGFAPGNWDDLDALTAQIHNEKPDIIAYSILINPMGQLKAIEEHPLLLEELRSSYKCKKWGKVVVWERAE